MRTITSARSGALEQARYVTGAKLNSSGAAAGLNIKFDNAVSGLVEAEYLRGNNVGLKLRYVSEKYEAKGYRGSVDAQPCGHRRHVLLLITIADY